MTGYRKQDGSPVHWRLSITLVGSSYMVFKYIRFSGGFKRVHKFSVRLSDSNVQSNPVEQVAEI